jgi:transcriptional regulator with XRE-family HTH domain
MTPAPETFLKVRKALGLSQRELALVLGLEKKAPQEWELGRCAPKAPWIRDLFDRLAKLDRALLAELGEQLATQLESTERDARLVVLRDLLRAVAPFTPAPPATPEGTP